MYWYQWALIVWAGLATGWVAYSVWGKDRLDTWPENVLTWRNGEVWEVMDTTLEQDVAIKEFLSSYGRHSFMRGVYTCAILIVALELIYYILSNYS